MDIITILIITLTVFNTLFFVINTHKLNLVRSFLVIITGVIFLFHIKEMRWQLYPIYILNFIFLSLLILSPLLSIKNNHLWNKRFIKVIIKTVMTLLVLISMFASYAFPIYKMPKPSGDHLIGTMRYDIVDNTRLETYSEDPSDYRHIQYQIWYPTEDTEGYEKVPWLQDGVPVAKGVAQMMELPPFILNHTARIESNSYANAPISELQPNYPVVVISHGWTGFRNLHTDYAELLASHGYIVISIDHTYGSAITVFEDGTTIPYNPDAIPNRELTPDFLSYGNRLVNTYANDITNVLDHIQLLQTGQISSQFKGKFNLDRIGLLGHSTGAGAGVTTAINDERVKVVIGLDAWVEPINDSLRLKGLRQPSLFLRSQQWEDKENNPYLVELLSKSNHSNLYQINETNHLDFTMVYMYSPLTSQLGISGKLDGRKSSAIQKDFILHFFNAHLQHNLTKTIEDVSKQYNDDVIKVDYLKELNRYQTVE